MHYKFKTVRGGFLGPNFTSKDRQTDRQTVRLIFKVPIKINQFLTHCSFHAKWEKTPE